MDVFVYYYKNTYMRTCTCWSKPSHVPPTNWRHAGRGVRRRLFQGEMAFLVCLVCLDWKGSRDWMHLRVN